MLKDEFGTVYNGPETFRDIANRVGIYHSCLIPWTDRAGTQYDILFTTLPASMQIESRALIQGGVKRYDLFVSIMRVGAFGFEMDQVYTHPGYYGEKLKLVGDETNARLAELINGVKKEILKGRGLDTSGLAPSTAKG